MPPLNVLVPVVGLVYFGLFLGIFVVFQVLTSGFAAFLYLFIIYTIASLATALVIWRRFRFGFLLGIIVSGLIMITLSLAPKPNGLLDVLSNPASTGEFIQRVTTFPALLAALAYSILGWREKSLKTTSPIRMIPWSSLIGTLLVGFILGGLIVGVLAGAAMSSLYSSSGTGADIVIVQGAANSNNGQFFVPASFTVHAGATVTWVNHDAMPHTVY